MNVHNVYNEYIARFISFHLRENYVQSLECRVQEQ